MRADYRFNRSQRGGPDGTLVYRFRRALRDGRDDFAFDVSFRLPGKPG